MNPLPDRLNLDHLKKQAKQLLRLYRSRDAVAMARFRGALPAAAGGGDEELLSRQLRLHDAQSCIAREHGFASWSDLKQYVEVQAGAQQARAVRILHWLQLIYRGDVSGTSGRTNLRVGLRMLAEDPELVAGDPWLACAIGDEDALRQVMQADPSWVNLRGGPLQMPPLLAVAHSGLLRVDEFRARLHASARLLIAAGADVNQRIHSRWPPASLEKPDTRYPLSTLYGAAGANHDHELTKLLLDAGADPNDGESLYHSLESPACTRLLLEHGARIAESNAIYRAIDLEDDTALKLLLAHGGDPNEPACNAPLTDWGSPLAWAIYRRRPSHVKALLDAGADPSRPTQEGLSPYRLALQFGLTEAAALLKVQTGAPEITDDESFIAAAHLQLSQCRWIGCRVPDFDARRSGPAVERHQRSAHRLVGRRGEIGDGFGRRFQADPFAEIGIRHVGAVCRRVERRRGHGIDQDALGLEFFGHRHRHGRDRRLAGGVGDHAGAAPGVEPGARGDVDDAA